MMYAPLFFISTCDLVRNRSCKSQLGGHGGKPEDSGLEHLAARAGCGDGQFWTWGASGHGWWWCIYIYIYISQGDKKRAFMNRFDPCHSCLLLIFLLLRTTIKGLKSWTQTNNGKTCFDRSECETRGPAAFAGAVSCYWCFLGTKDARCASLAMEV